MIAESLLQALQPLCNNELELLSPGGRTSSVGRTSVRPGNSPQPQNELKSVPLSQSSAPPSIRDAYKPGTLTNIACFTSMARYEITWHGKKVVGSAQRRFGNAVLQHGSILLGDEHLALPEYLKITTEEKSEMRKMLAQETATLSGICKRHVTIEEAVKQFGESLVISR